jgi:hypothetical protein
MLCKMRHLLSKLITILVDMNVVGRSLSLFRLATIFFFVLSDSYCSLLIVFIYSMQRMRASRCVG